MSKPVPPPIALPESVARQAAGADDPPFAHGAPTPAAAKKVLVVFGTRPEIIKLAPVIRELEAHAARITTVTVTTAQHTDLLYPFIRLFDIRIDHNLQCMSPRQTLNGLSARLLEALDPVLVREAPALVLVQGDTSTAMAGALAAFHRRIPVGHVEAGLRTHCSYSPYPEEMNRRLVTQLAKYHFAPTRLNRENLLAEGVDPKCIFLTGNPVVDALHAILQAAPAAPLVEKLLQATQGQKRVVLTMHRRESLGPIMAACLQELRAFVDRHADVALLFPVHANPSVRQPSYEILSGHKRVHLLDPLDYRDFIGLLAQAWLVASDSGGVQEEAPTLGKPLLVLREQTERPEAIEAGVARLVGVDPRRLREALESVYRDERWVQGVKQVANPFGQGDSARQIVQALRQVLDDGNEINVSAILRDNEEIIATR